MTLQQERASDTHPSPTPTGRTGPASAVWLVWRQHGGLLVASVVVTAVLCIALRLAHSSLAGLHCTTSPYDLSDEGPAGTCGGLAAANHNLFTWSLWLLRIAAFLPVAAGLFWGAPLVSREYERGTQGLAWGQGLSAERWLRRKLAVFAGLAVLLGVPLWLCARQVAESTTGLADWLDGGRFGWEGFAALAPMAVPYSVAALMVGVLCSIVLRRTLPAMAVAGTLCAVLGPVTADYVRPHYAPPVAVHYAASLNDLPIAGDPMFLVDNVWADAGGNPTNRSPGRCETDACLADRGIFGRVSIYQPGSREAEFQWIEAGLCLALAGAFLLLSGRLLRRR